MITNMHRIIGELEIEEGKNKKERSNINRRKI
jgi:hypothetical protein